MTEPAQRHPVVAPLEIFKRADIEEILKKHVSDKYGFKNIDPQTYWHGSTCMLSVVVHELDTKADGSVRHGTRRTNRNPTETERELLEHCRAMEHEKLDEISLMHLVTQYTVEKYGSDRNIAIQLNPDTMTATFYEVSEEGRGTRKFNLKRHSSSIVGSRTGTAR